MQLELASTDALVEELRKRCIASCGVMLTQNGSMLMEGYDCGVSIWDSGTPQHKLEIVTQLFNFVLGKISNNNELTDEEIIEIITRR